MEENGLEIKIPKFLLSPVIWVLLGVVILGGIYIFLAKPFEFVKNQTEKPKTAIPISSSQASSQTKTLGFFQKVSDSPVTVEKKSYFLYVGGQFCPFCAAERWSLVKALSRFGTWSGLSSDQSSDGSVVAEPFLNIPTYNFINAKYKSDYISFAHKETADRQGRLIKREELTDFEKQWNDKYNPRGTVPFLFLGGKYVQVSAGYSPALLTGKNFEEVKRNIDQNNTSEAYVLAINKEADIITAYLCKATGNQPASICNKPEIATLVAQVP